MIGGLNFGKNARKKDMRLSDDDDTPGESRLTTEVMISYYIIIVSRRHGCWDVTWLLAMIQVLFHEFSGYSTT